MMYIYEEVDNAWFLFSNGILLEMCTILMVVKLNLFFLIKFILHWNMYRNPVQ